MPDDKNLAIVVTEPWRLRAIKVNPEQPRIRLPKTLSSAVPWLSALDKDVPSLATVGAKGGIMISPNSALSARTRIAKELSVKQLNRRAIGSELLDYVRHCAAGWPLTISVEASRHTLHLPDEARKLGLVPGSGERAIVFAAGEILEVWVPSEFLTYLRGVSGSIGRLEEVVLQELDSEASED